MKTTRYEGKDIEAVANLLKDGKVVAFPTDTVFGLGVIYDNEDALNALKMSKGRPENKPIPTMVSSIRQIEEIAYMSESAIKLAEEFMPGAFTLIVKKKESLPAYLTNGMDTVGIRMPDDDFVLHLIDLCEKPLLVTSANMSGEETGINEEEVLQQLGGRIDAIVIGKAGIGMASTIVDCSTTDVRIVREGPISEKQIREVVGK